MTILYPQWVPGGHSPRNDLDKMAGLVITAGGKTLPWTRDPVAVHAFHIDVPDGATQIEISFQFLTPVKPDVGRILVTDDMLNVQWLQLGFYPAGYYTRGIQIEPTVKLPEGWGFGTAWKRPRPAARRPPSRPRPSRPWSTRRCSPAATSSRSTWIRTARCRCA
jgi:predicted metalloprotease with PDZ domain